MADSGSNANGAQAAERMRQYNLQTAGLNAVLANPRIDNSTLCLAAKIMPRSEEAKFFRQGCAEGRRLLKASFTANYKGAR